MPIALPPDSLGPKPTKKQMELLLKMAVAGATVHTWRGVTLGSGGAYIKIAHSSEFTGVVNTHEKINQGEVSKFYDWGWLEKIDEVNFLGDGDYRVSERGRKVIAKGVTR